MFKQLVINRLSTNGTLCDDVLPIIKSFCFYDIQTVKHMCNVKQMKKKVVATFQKAVCSRFRPNGFYEYGVDPDTSESWITCLSFVSKYKTNIVIHEKLFERVNCKMCGGYMVSLPHYDIPKKIICYCE
jgi:hypothetical protein